MNELRSILQRLRSAPAGGALATLVAVSGSSYRRPGARLLLTPDGVRTGSISGGCLEEDVLARARRVALSGTAELVTYDTTAENDLVWGVGLGCHGVVHVLLEKLPPDPAWVAELADNLDHQRPTPLAVVWRSPDSALLGTRRQSELGAVPAGTDVFLNIVAAPVPLVIFGAGDDAQPLVRLAKELGWHVTVADPRPAFATAGRFPTADVLVVAPATELVARISLSPLTVAVVMTHHYMHDVPLLRELRAHPLAYVGLLGPKKRAERIRADLDAAGAPAPVTTLHAPVGLDLGAETPAEVALSIIAEIRATLAGRDARPLRERVTPIHEVFAPQKPDFSISTRQP